MNPRRTALASSWAKALAAIALVFTLGDCAEACESVYAITDLDGRFRATGPQPGNLPVRRRWRSRQPRTYPSGVPRQLSRRRADPAAAR